MPPDACEWAAPVVSWIDDAGCTRPRSRHTRRTLLLAAARTFDERGYHAATLRDILTGSGLTKGALYFHFRSKEELARALAREVLLSWRAVVDDISSRGLDPIWQLLVETDAVAGRRMYDPVVRGAWRAVAEADAFIPDRKKWLHHWLSGIEGHLRAAVREGVVHRDVQPARGARLIQAVHVGHVELCEAVGDSRHYWTRVCDMWEGMLPLITAEGWMCAWEASGWRSRLPPDPQEYARARRP